MSRLRTSPQGPTGTPIAFLLARQVLAAQHDDWVEAPMRRYEMPSLVDIARRDGAADVLSRILDI